MEFILTILAVLALIPTVWVMWCAAFVITKYL